MDIDRHNIEIHQNKEYWHRKPVLSKIYTQFYRIIADHLSRGQNRKIVELGSGIGNLKQVIPACICTDLFPNPWIDQVENAYRLSFQDHSVSDLVLFDVFHHLRYPGTALEECYRVLRPGGRLILFEPCVSILGRIVYGILHHEPLGLHQDIEWFAPENWKPEEIDYYASQANAWRIFISENFKDRLTHWDIVSIIRLSALSYVASGGFSKPQFYPDFAYPFMQLLDRIGDTMPYFFATRLLVVMEKST